MSDYIKRDDALSICHPVMPTDGVGTIGLTYDEIKNIPTADVVEVVRCKNCKHFRSNPSGTIGKCYKLSYILNPNFYCAFAERKERNDAERTD